MKIIKISSFILISCLLFLVSCTTTEDTSFNHDQDLDLENVFFDDFTNGINPEHWNIGNEIWGVGNGGVVPQNVNYTEDGVVILQANGDLYEGDILGFGKTNGKRSGSRITTREQLGPGRYEVRMKAMPRFGSTTAMWTYYYENGANHEIDIEMNVENDFHRVWTTNWISLNEYTTKKHTLDYVLNDGEYRTFRFDWRTNPSRIDYFIDDVLVSTQESYVPTFAGVFNIGNWFPDAWAGVPDFETDYTYVDWFKYTPFQNNAYIPTPPNPASPKDHYPSAPVDYPVANLISNSGFETESVAWRKDVTSKVEVLDGEGINGSRAIKIPKDDITYQFVSGLDESFEMRLIANAKLPKDGSGYMLLEFYPLETSKIDQLVIPFSSTDKDFVENQFYQKEVVFQVPVGTKRVEISLIGEQSEIYFDDLFMNLSKKATPNETNNNNPQDYDIFEDFSNGINQEIWALSNQKWGGNHHGGVVYDNVGYTSDGLLVIQANGDHYEGDIKGIDQNDGKRTGGAIYTKEALGPGSYEVRAKILPRFGATSAFWTYNWLNGINSEIDFEFNVDNDFHSVWLTNWLTEQDSLHYEYTMDKVHNDNEFHTYRFDWHTEPTPKIEFYIDNVLVYTATTKVPTLSARFWIGVWFPNNWAGNPNFETDYMLVDYFKYKAFEGQAYQKGPTGADTPSIFYPTKPMELETTNLISHGDFSHKTGYTLTGNAVINNGVLTLNNGTASQQILGVDSTFEMTLSVLAKGTGEGKVRIEYLNKDLQQIGFIEMDLNGLNNEYKKVEKIFNLVKDIKGVNVIVSGNNITLDDLFFNLSNKVK